MNPYDIYRKQDLETSNKQELVGKLFNEASVSLKRARLAVEQNDLFAANESIKKAEVIVKTLNNSLDMQYDISVQLRRLYTYMDKRMLEANLNKDPEILSEISGMLSELRDTWFEAIRRSKKMQSS
ncbi:MAG TPA: flagellar export chaperone FliS [Ruminiclostridium sp.]|nr:flagellar export chaperone FliS [Ruminiclostridium sp.]